MSNMYLNKFKNISEGYFLVSTFLDTMYSIAVGCL